MKINWLKVAEGIVMGVTVAAGIAQAVIADKKLDNKIAEEVAKALENK